MKQTRQSLVELYLATAFKTVTKHPSIPYDTIPLEYHAAVSNFLRKEYEEAAQRAEKWAKEYAEKNPSFCE